MSHRTDEVFSLLPSRYRFISRLGQGGFGVVAKAFDTQLQKEVAVKAVTCDLENEVTARAIFREIQVNRLFQNPTYKSSRILSAYDTIVLQGGQGILAYIVLEIMDFDLLSFIEEYGPRLNNYQKIFIMLQIFLALDELHQLNIYHRDLQPGNIFISRDFRVKIGDFGLARFFPLGMQNDAKNYISAIAKHKLTDNVVVVNYRAPELCVPGMLKNQNYTKAIDIWSLGCVCMFLFLGRLFIEVGQSAFDQFCLITEIFGTPTKNNHASFYRSMSEKETQALQDKMYPTDMAVLTKLLSQEASFNDYKGIELLYKMFKYDFRERISIEKIMNHSFVTSRMRDYKKVQQVDLKRRRFNREDLARVVNFFKFESLNVANHNHFILKALLKETNPYLLGDVFGKENFSEMNSLKSDSLFKYGNSSRYVYDEKSLSRIGDKSISRYGYGNKDSFRYGYGNKESPGYGYGDKNSLRYGYSGKSSSSRYGYSGKSSSSRYGYGEKNSSRYGYGNKSSSSRGLIKSYEHGNSSRYGYKQKNELELSLNIKSQTYKDKPQQQLVRQPSATRQPLTQIPGSYPRNEMPMSQFPNGYSRNETQMTQCPNEHSRNEMQMTRCSSFCPIHGDPYRKFVGVTSNSNVITEAPKTGSFQQEKVERADFSAEGNTSIAQVEFSNNLKYEDPNSAHGVHEVKQTVKFKATKTGRTGVYAFGLRPIGGNSQPYILGQPGESYERTTSLSRNVRAAPMQFPPS